MMTSDGRNTLPKIAYRAGVGEHADRDHAAETEPGQEPARGHHDRDLRELADAHRRPDAAVGQTEHLAHERAVCMK